jgi:L-asparaginase II
MNNTDIGQASAEPLIVELYRGTLLESSHLIDVAVVDVDGKIIESFGEFDRTVYARSACKPLQALPLIETGAADALGLSNKQIAIACGSHTGEDVHVSTAMDWLESLGLDDSALECGGHLPRNLQVCCAFARSGEPLRQANNNCSGKHAGMLSHALHCGDNPSGYIALGHPVQKRVASCLSEMYGVSLDRAPVGIDGCGIPTFAVPIKNMALSMARLANPVGLDPDRAESCRRIATAMMAEPYMVAGRDRACTQIMEACGGRAVVKVGAEGVYMAGVVGGGVGIAIKARDGAMRAAEVAVAALLQRHSEPPLPVPAALLNRRIADEVGKEVGFYRVISSDRS